MQLNQQLAALTAELLRLSRLQPPFTVIPAWREDLLVLLEQATQALRAESEPGTPVENSGPEADIRQTERMATDGRGMPDEELNILIIKLLARITDQDQQARLAKADAEIALARHAMELSIAKGDEPGRVYQQSRLAKAELAKSRLELEFAEAERLARQG